MLLQTVLNRREIEREARSSAVKSFRRDMRIEASVQECLIRVLPDGVSQQSPMVLRMQRSPGQSEQVNLNPETL